MHRWTAEEGRHAIAMRDYLLPSRAVDPVELERLRMRHMAEGFEADNSHGALHSMKAVIETDALHVCVGANIWFRDMRNRMPVGQIICGCATKSCRSRAW